jgi:TonB family protein
MCVWLDCGGNMRKLIIFLLVNAVFIFSDQVAITTNGVEITLKDDGSWLIKDIPDETEWQIFPIAVTEDSQLVLLKDIEWEYISPDDTIDASYDTINLEVVPYYRVDTKPLLRAVVRPVYPGSAWSKGHEGSVVVKVLVDVDGQVTDVDILESSGYMELDQAAIKAVWRAKFTPAIYHGKPVRVWVSIPFRFKFTDN